MEPTNADLIRRAHGVLRPVRVGDRLIGDVGSALVTPTGNVYTGVCVDTASWGLCAERSAMATMITAGEYQIRAIVAVWQEWEQGDGDVYVLPPCGHCRQFIQDIDPANLDTDVILSAEESAPLRDLLPRNRWPTRPVALPKA